MDYNLGVVTNCWKTVLENGEPFEEVVVRFCRQGFDNIEIRDGDYLRHASIGGFVGRIERMMMNYDTLTWREMCDRIHRAEGWRGLIRDGDSSLAEEVERFVARTAGARFSYAMSYPWLSRPLDLDEDTRRITTAIKLAYLINPRRPRLRLVSLEQMETIDTEAAVLNLKRYRSLEPDFRMTLTVENARHPAPLFLELSRAGGVLLAYDEANNYRPDGTGLNTPEEFWRSVTVEDLASVHLKQKSYHGALTRLGDGFVDLHAVMDRLNAFGYSGDLLLENAPTEDPLGDAIASCDYMFTTSL